MKKILGFLSSVSLTVSTASSVIACTPIQANVSFEKDYTIGKNLDKSNAKDTSSDPEKHFGFSNFFTLGDSLSDNYGLTTIIKDELGANAKMTGEYKEGFSNGPTAARLVNSALGFSSEEFVTSNIIHKADVTNEKYKDTKVWGKNYSIGGATAFVSDGVAGKLLMGNTGIYKQAQALVQQQVINDKDLFFIEIGGNDLFEMLKNINDYNHQVSVMNQALENIKNAFYTLLNNGARRIVFAAPPKMTIIPRFNKENDEVKKNIERVNKEFDVKISKIVKKINESFGDVILEYNLYLELENILNGFKKEIGNDANTTDALCTSNAFNLGDMDFSNIELNAQIKDGNNGKGDNFFFIDEVHPTKKGHEYVSKIFIDIVKEKWKSN